MLALRLWPVLGASFSAGAPGWGVASGPAPATAFTLPYRTPAIGPMNVLPPVTAPATPARPHPSSPDRTELRP